MMYWWIDLQETFYLLIAPFLVGLLLPFFVGSGILLAIAKAIQKFFQKGGK